jgi:hypothetical protein
MSVSPCRQADDRFARRAHIEAIQLRQQLIQRLLALAVAHAVAAQVESDSKT